MPYIKKEERKKYDQFVDQLVSIISVPVSKNVREGPLPGHINYIITTLLYKLYKEAISYANINEVMGILECVKQEFYRRVAAPYEDKKKEESGDVYG